MIRQTYLPTHSLHLATLIDSGNHVNLTGQEGRYLKRTGTSLLFRLVSMLRITFPFATYKYGF